ncbi:hypothetical protein CLU97_2058 [Chryseobacterium sp. 7]|nr:hypothetical protein [Chryseobacterium sp. 7]RLJ32597.1 hypothetical protein CLU97_2058 [Chryseobacterium sp. 7]
MSTTLEKGQTINFCHFLDENPVVVRRLSNKMMASYLNISKSD